MKIREALTAIIGELGAIEKTQRNEVQKYDYRGIDQVYNALSEKLSKYGVLITTKNVKSEYHHDVKIRESFYTRCKVLVTYRIESEDNSFIEAEFPGEALDAFDKATPKAMTAAYKYMLFQMLCIKTSESVDADGTEFPDTKSQLTAPKSSYAPQANLSGALNAPPQQSQKTTQSVINRMQQKYIENPLDFDLCLSGKGVGNNGGKWTGKRASQVPLIDLKNYLLFVLKGKDAARYVEWTDKCKLFIDSIEHPKKAELSRLPNMAPALIEKHNSQPPKDDAPMPDDKDAPNFDSQEEIHFQ